MEKILKSPKTLLLNAIRLPSGDQTGPKFRAVLLVTRVTSLPSAFITKI